MFYGRTEKQRELEDLIRHNFLLYFLLNPFFEFFRRWFPRDMQSTLSHYPAEITIPIPHRTMNFVLSFNFSHFWPILRNVLTEGNAE